VCERAAQREVHAAAQAVQREVHAAAQADVATRLSAARYTLEKSLTPNSTPSTIDHDSLTYTLNPTPFIRILHPTPFTLHPEP
jgi:hypothetical protein